MDFIKSITSFFNDIKTVVSMIIDYSKGKYKDVPLNTFAAILFACIYLLMPIDLIPDLIPVFGVLDDIAVIRLILFLIKSDIEKYRLWKDSNEIIS